jgi:hypothetical protein
MQAGVLRARILGVMNEAPAANDERQAFEEFEAAAAPPLRQRFRYAFIRTYKPVLDDGS